MILAPDQEKKLCSWFHGTDAKSASSIALGKGIDIDKGTGTKDFSDGNGFYLSDSFQKAQEWIKKKRFAACEFTAILQYKITKVIQLVCFLIIDENKYSSAFVPKPFSTESNVYLVIQLST